MKNANTHVALYGNVKMLRSYCNECRSWALILDGRFLCCDAVSDEIPTRSRRMSLTEEIRRLPSASEQKHILLDQSYRCLYCERSFGRRAKHGSKFVKLRLEWDHMVPWSFSQDNRSANFAATCQLCNRIKTDLVFQTIEEARTYVRLQLDLPPVDA